MKVVLTNLSSKLYEKSRFRLNNSAKRNGIVHINSYDFEDIKKSSFYLDNKNILNKPKGMGYWLWKPYIILETMKTLSDGDIVIYSDCGIEVIDNLQPLINICLEQHPILLFANGDFRNLEWTKRDCFVLMGCDNELYWNGRQCDAAFSLFRKSEASLSFLNEWLQYCSNEKIITDLPNQCGKENLQGFIDHRQDQSILSLLAQLHQVPLFRMPTQFGNHYKLPEYRVNYEFNCVNQLNQKQVSNYAKEPSTNSPYAQLLNHHRTKSGVVEDIKKIYRKIKKIFCHYYMCFAMFNTITVKMYFSNFLCH
jgi:hypothetical protein